MTPNFFSLPRYTKWSEAFHYYPRRRHVCGRPTGVKAIAAASVWSWRTRIGRIFKKTFEGKKKLSDEDVCKSAMDRGRQYPDI